MKENEVFYGNKFFDSQVNGSLKSAKVILELLWKFYKPTSIVDFGCGRGTWLYTAELMGVKDLKGYDGEWVAGKIISKNIDFSAIDLEDIKIDPKKYDLAISVEVAEHISEEAAKNLVKVMCKSSDIILFSAAIKNQGGTNHINEQSQSYWVNLYKAEGFDCLDVIRPEIWDNKEVEWWYRQNIFLFVKHLEAHKLNLEHYQKNIKSIFDIVHPNIYEHRMSQLKEKENQIGLMESSLFWKIRNSYIKFKKSF